MTPPATADALLREFTRRLPQLGSPGEVTTYDGNPAMRFSAASTRVGDAIVEFERDEITVYIGTHTHVHFGAYMYEFPTSEEQVRAVVDEAIKYLHDLFSDELAIWSLAVAGKARSGGTFRRSRRLGAAASRLLPKLGADVMVWSGAQVP